MKNEAETEGDLVEILNERAKELKCLYKIEEILKIPSQPEAEKFAAIIKEIPQGWQYRSLCRVRLEMDGREYTSENFAPTPWFQKSEIVVDDVPSGALEIYYGENISPGPNSPFLAEEQKLLESIAERIGHYLSEKKLKTMVEGLNHASRALNSRERQRGSVILDLLQQIDIILYRKIARKMLNHLCRIGSEEARSILQCVGRKHECRLPGTSTEANSPMERLSRDSINNIGPVVFPIAEKVLNEEELVNLIKKWTNEEKAGFLTKTLEMPETSLGEISDAVYRFYHREDKKKLSAPAQTNLTALLLRRVFTEQTGLIALARAYVAIEDFYPVLQQTIYHSNCQGKLGGKSTGLFVMEQILKRQLPAREGDFPVKVPKTWHIASGIMNHFIFLNNLEEIYEQRYKPVEEIREEYPNIIQIFKNCHFPPGIMKELSHVLDDFGETPIIVRSSSLLEDRLGAAFSGKYKSLFLANQGPRPQRLTALMDAIAEVYASMFGPDPIEYRREKGLLDFKEEMAVMIQEVVGTRVGPYFLPAFAGVAFSHNEFRWSPRIKREDGLLRLVPGLGTRAVDRIGNDYPKLIAPGRPELEVNVTPDEVRRYAPRFVDLINTETNSFETVEIAGLLRRWGDDYPGVEKIVSVFRDQQLATKSRLQLDFESDELTVTFDGLTRKTAFVDQMKRILDTCRESLDNPMDIEFASDGTNLYLLQCRPQSSSEIFRPASIPQDMREDRILFTAGKYVSNGSLSRLTHIVYVDPEEYERVPDHETLQEIGRAVGKLNTILPRRQFILMGPGRWGSRGDIKLGVSVGYADISNTALLVEIARRKGRYVPDLSFGTHFFQDLVEAAIRYLPLYPEEEGNIFNHRFLKSSGNLLPQLLPEHSRLEPVLSVIDIPRETDGLTLTVRMNDELDEAMAFFCTGEAGGGTVAAFMGDESGSDVNYWQWRQRMAERIAEEMDFDAFGVEAFYLFGSTKNGSAGMGSDIDILIHFTGDSRQKRELLLWLSGWSRCLAEINYLKTGYVSDGLLDIHLVTQEDIAGRDSFAMKIGAVSDAARLLRERAGD